MTSFQGARGNLAVAGCPMHGALTAQAPEEPHGTHTNPYLYTASLLFLATVKTHYCSSVRKHRYPFLLH